MRTALLALCLACTTALSAAEIEVVATCPWSDQQGFVPVVVEALNRGSSPAVLDLDVESDTQRARDRLEVPAAGRARATVLLPASRGWSGISVRWWSRDESGRENAGAAHEHRCLAVALVDPGEALPLPDLKTALASAVPSFPTGSYRSAAAEVDRIAPGSLPNRWQGYPAWLTVLLTPAGWRQLDADQRRALAAWTLAGGAVFATEGPLLAELAGQGIRAAPAMVGGGNADAGIAGLVHRVRSVADDAGWQPTPLDIPGLGRAPVAGFVVVAIVFTLVAGPLNFWWCRRRRGLLLLTTPAISLATCVLLLLVGLLGEGLGRRRAAVQLAILDTAGHRMAAWSSATWYAALPVGGIAFDPLDLILAVDRDAGRRERGTERSLDWRGPQPLATAGWLPSRQASALVVATVRPEQRRLAISSAPAGLVLANHLGVAIEDFAWSAPDGTCWRTGFLAAGGAAVLERGAPGIDALGGLPPAFTAAARAALAQLPQAGRFRATLAAPLLPLPGPDATEAAPPRAWVAGVLAMEKP